MKKVIEFDFNNNVVEGVGRSQYDRVSSYYEPENVTPNKSPGGSQWRHHDFVDMLSPMDYSHNYTKSLKTNTRLGSTMIRDDSKLLIKTDYATFGKTNGLATTQHLSKPNKYVRILNYLAFRSYLTKIWILTGVHHLSQKKQDVGANPEEVQRMKLRKTASLASENTLMRGNNLSLILRL